jgi:hypothetical protein
VGMALLGTMYPAAHPVQWGHCTAKHDFRMSWTDARQRVGGAEAERLGAAPSMSGEARDAPRGELRRSLVNLVRHGLTGRVVEMVH